MPDIQSLLENLNSSEIQILDELIKYSIRVSDGVWVLSESPHNLVENVTNNIATGILKAIINLEEKGLIEKKDNDINLNQLGKKVATYLQGTYKTVEKRKVVEDLKEKTKSQSKS